MHFNLSNFGNILHTLTVYVFALY